MIGHDVPADHHMDRVSAPVVPEEMLVVLSLNKTVTDESKRVDSTQGPST